MTDFEPYVTDPAEAPPRPRLAGARPAVVTLLVAVLLGAAALFTMRGDVEDPSLNVPAGGPGTQTEPAP